MTDKQSNRSRKKSAGKQSTKGRSVIQVISDIKNGLFDPKLLKKSDRQICVQYLGSEGFSVAELAHLLKVDERTINRDRKEIRQSNALQYDPQLPGQLAGQILQDTEASCSRIERAIRGSNTSVEAVINAQHVKSDIRFKAYQLLQSLGFLPKDAQPQITGLMGSHPGLQELQQLTSKLLDLDDQAQSTNNATGKKKDPS